MKIEFVDKNRLIPKGRGKERQRVRGRERENCCKGGEIGRTGRR